jgi:hypothetical protein
MIMNDSIKILSKNLVKKSNNLENAINKIFHKDNLQHLII